MWFPPASGTDGQHSVKDIRSGEQRDADPDSWLPPASDLKPQIKEPHS